MLISFIIPCYNSENTIEFVISEISKKMLEREDLEYEILAINDDSPDDVLSKLVILTQTNSNLRVIDLAKNVGKESALMAGYKIARGDIVTVLDDDGQCPISELWRLLEPLGDNYDVSIAAYNQKKQSKVKNIGSSINSLMTQLLLNKPRELKLSNYMALKRFVVDEIIKNDNPFPYSLGVILNTTHRIANVLMEERERYAGKGNFTLKKSLSLWLNGFTAFSVKPLRIASLIGILCSFLGFGYGLFTVVRKLVIPNISVGWSSTVSIMLFIGGLLMLMLGVIGEYIGRIYICINRNSQYVIRKRINFKD